jgi:hypothetical protein
MKDERKRDRICRNADSDSNRENAAMLIHVGLVLAAKAAA